MNTGLFKLGVPDFVKTFVMIVLGALVTGVTASLNAGALPTLETLKTAALAGLGTGGAYLIKQFFTNSNGQFAQPEAK